MSLFRIEQTATAVILADVRAGSIDDAWRFHCVLLGIDPAVRDDGIVIYQIADVTYEQIAALRDEAEAVGDHLQVAICKVALGSRQDKAALEARDICWDVIRRAKAMED